MQRNIMKFGMLLVGVAASLWVINSVPQLRALTKQA